MRAPLKCVLQGQSVGAAPSRRAKEQEHTVLVNATLDLLARHPRVAWAKRMNSFAGYLAHRNKQTGEMKVGSRFVRAGFPGLADILGQLKGGAMLAIEAKVPPDELTDDQAAFLEAVNAAGGKAFVVRDPVDVLTNLGHGRADDAKAS